MAVKDDIKNNALDAAMISAGSKGMGGGTITTIVGYLSSSGFAVLVGVLVTIIGFCFSIFFQRRQHIRNRDKWELEKHQMIAEENRKKELHELKVRQLRMSANEINTEG